ncbi:2-keto-4-pentenoate hydratase [Mycolicibacterium sp. 050158]|uniref:2-keto-4-pentenoate hydratase n=1 Tax=Mycolicibacterium sp. 050158 TaxID=3090602 RepID=UPI00299D1798|nr:2-keto-4-pentenoate hydratase [Mycolicibacterium sp. 050158]MDX1893464.1 2-keto-4-pentenoate hydratase [Mycolicibacterium sp. 050158]
MLDIATRDAAARLLRCAERKRRPIDPLIESFPHLDVDDAYAIQRANVAERLAGDVRICGHKIGLSSPVMQQMMGVDEPDFGHLLTDMIVEDGTVVDLSSLCHPRIEVEVAFVLGAALPGDCTPEDVLNATEYVSAAIELIDSRILNWRIGIIDTIADNASSGMFVLGRDRWAPDAVDLADVDAALYSGFGGRDVLVTRGSTSAVLGHPANAVAWLARTLSAYDVTLEAGHVVLSGSCTRAVDVAKGDHFRAELTGLGEVFVEFT